MNECNRDGIHGSIAIASIHALTTPSVEWQKERERYDLAWERYTLANALFWTLFLGYIPGVFLITWLLSFFVNYNSVFGPVAITWMVIWAIASIPRQTFRCPRCGNKFYARKKWGVTLVNGFATQCMTCGLEPYEYD